MFDAADAPGAFSTASRANRRRRRVFLTTLVLACIASLLYVYLRPAHYETKSRWQFAFAAAGQPSTASGLPAGDAGEQALLTQLQVITSRPLLEKLRAQLRARDVRLPADDSVEALQRSLRVRPLAGTAIVEVAAEGLSRAPLAPTVNTLFEVYQRQLGETYRARSGDAWDQAREESLALQARVAQKRSELDDFRARYQIVSLERDENQVLAQLKGQSSSLNTANDKLIAAEAKLKSLRVSIAAGRGVARARDDPTLAAIEKRQSEASEELRGFERKFTEDYMKLDPDMKARRARLASLNEQLRQARIGSQQAALADAEEELGSARAAAGTISAEMKGAQNKVQAFTARLAEYKNMREEMNKLEEQKGIANARATELEVGARRAAPKVTLLESASTPLSAAWPNYTRDAGIAVGGSLLLALLMMGLVELLNRPEPSPTVVVLDKGWGPASMGPGAPPIEFDHPAPAIANVPLAPRVLEAAPLPRELEESEVAALLAGAATPSRALLMALLSGLSAEEAAALRWEEVDLSAPAIRLKDRSVTLAASTAAVFSELAEGGAAGDAPVFASALEDRPTVAEIDADVAFAAHDAGLAYPNEIKAATLRHTCAAHLVRQGARFGDLSRWVGHLPSGALGVYARIAPMGPKRPAAEIDPVHPALRRL